MRRRNGNGYVGLRRGKWVAIADAGTDADGKRQQRWLGSFDTQREANAVLRDFLGKKDKGVPTPRESKDTLAQYLRTWFAGREGNVRASTLDADKRSIARAVKHLGARKVREIQVADVDALYRTLAGEGLGPRSIRQVHIMLGKSFADGVKRQAGPTWNPVRLATPPRAERYHAATWSGAELARFVGYLRSRTADVRALFILYLSTGMRRGEALGLRRSDVDLEAGTVQVAQTVVLVNGKPILQPEPKTPAGYRRIGLDAEAVAALRAHIDARPTIGDALLFARYDGQMMRPDTVVHQFAKLSKAAGLPHIRLHDVRHSYAGAAVAAGVPLEVVSKRLGHESIAITHDIYGHIMPEVDQRAADAVAAYIRNAAPEPEADVVAFGS